MHGPRTARTFLVAQLALMVAAYFLIAALHRESHARLSDLDEVAFVLTYLAIGVITVATFRTVRVLRGIVPRTPCAPAEIRGTFAKIRGTVAARADPSDGPDGRPCVAALRAEYSLAGQNRWIPFSLEVDGEEFRVQPSEPEAVIKAASAMTWKHTAVRPRSFARAAWASELVDEKRLDWVCVRPGDFIELRGSLHWAAAPVEGDGSTLVRAVVDEPSTTSPYRTTHAPVIDLHRLVHEDPEAGVRVEYYSLAIEVIHPEHDLAWRKREVVRKATLVCQLAAGIAVFSWISFAFEQLGFLAPMPWLLFVLAAVLLMPVYGAYVASTLPIARTDPTPPPWQQDAPTRDTRSPRPEVGS